MSQDDGVQLELLDELCDGVQLVAVHERGRGWSVTASFHRPATRWERGDRYERLTADEAADLMLQLLVDGMQLAD